MFFFRSAAPLPPANASDGSSELLQDQHDSVKQTFVLQEIRKLESVTKQKEPDTVKQTYVLQV